MSGRYRAWLLQGEAISSAGSYFYQAQGAAARMK